jgi:hypothetical protein
LDLLLRLKDASRTQGAQTGQESISIDLKHRYGLELYFSTSLPSQYQVGSLEVNYVAEHHENLQHVMVFFDVTGAIPGVNLEVDIHSSADNMERFVVLSGAKVTLPFPLPARVSPGKVKVQSGHFELKLPTVGTPELPPPSSMEMYDATALSKSTPTAFICSSCSLPLVQSTKVGEYRDLPSEHWQELVDAWMCHSDQKLHKEVMENAKRGFWPKEGEALVGGSYILFEDGSVVKTHIRQLEAREVSIISTFWRFRMQRRPSSGYHLPAARYKQGSSSRRVRRSLRWFWRVPKV